MPDSTSNISELIDSIVENIDMLEDLADDPNISGMLTDHEARLVRELSLTISRHEGDWFNNTLTEEN